MFPKNIYTVFILPSFTYLNKILNKHFIKFRALEFSILNLNYVFVKLAYTQLMSNACISLFCNFIYLYIDVDGKLLSNFKK